MSASPLIESLCQCLTKPAVSDDLAREIALTVRALSGESPEVLAPHALRLVQALDAWDRTTGGTPESDAVARLIGTIPPRLVESLAAEWLEATPGHAERAEAESTISRAWLRYPEHLAWLAPPPRAPAPTSHLDTHRYEAFVVRCFDALAQSAGLAPDAYRARVLERLTQQVDRHWAGFDQVSTISGLLAGVFDELGRASSEDAAEVTQRLTREHAADPTRELRPAEVLRIRRLVEVVTDPATEIDRSELGDVDAELGEEFLSTDFEETRALLAAVVRHLGARGERLSPETWKLS